MATEERRPSAPMSSSARPVPPVRKKSGKRLLKKLSIVFVILVLAGGTAFFAYKYNQANKNAQRLADPKAAAAQQVTDLVTKVGKLVVLPTGETPTVATVTDTSKLQSQDFFKTAQNGDKVLIYTQAKKAVLYRPSQNKIIEIAPLNIGGNQQTGTTSGQ